MTKVSLRRASYEERLFAEKSPVSLAFMIVSALAHGYALITGVTATNNATIALVENVLNTIDTGLGGKGFSFPNDPAAA